MLRYFLLLLLSLPLLGQAQTGNLAWQHAYGTAENETGGYAVAMPAGGYMLLGSQPFLSGSQKRLYFVRTNAQGDTLWTKTLALPRTPRPEPGGMAVEASGNLVVTATDPTVSPGPGYVLKLTPTCDTIWTKRFYPTVTVGNTGTTGIANPYIAPDGNYVFLRSDGTTATSSPYIRFATSLFKLNSANRTQMWSLNLSQYLGTAGIDPYASSIDTFVPYSGGLIMPVDSYAPGNTIGIRGKLFVDNSGVPSMFVRETRNYQRDIAPAMRLTADGNIIMVRRQNITKISTQSSTLGDTIWHTVPPSRYQYRVWDAASVVEDATGNLLVAADSYIAPPSQTAFARNIHLVRFSRLGALLNDTLLYRAGADTFAGTAFVGPNGRDMLFTGYTTPGPYGANDLLMARYTGFRPLATAPEAPPVGAGLHLGLFPNPAGAGAAVQVALPEQRGGTLRLYDALGRAVARQAVPPGRNAVVLEGVSALPAGVYVLRYALPDGRSCTARLLRE